MAFRNHVLVLALWLTALAVGDARAQTNSQAQAPTSSAFARRVYAAPRPPIVPPAPPEIEQASFDERMSAIAPDDGSMSDDSCNLGCCQNDCAAPCAPCGPNLWVRAEYLVWWTKGMEVPALVTTSPAGTPQNQAGVLGEPGTSVLFGDGSLNNQAQSGGRISLGTWFDASHRDGIEATYLTLGTQSDNFAASSIQNPILARPFFNTEANDQDARLIGYPNFVAGNVGVVATTRFQTAELLYRYVACQTSCTRTDLFVGYRYGGLADHLRISESTVSLPEQDLTIGLFDRFNTRNNFNGGDFGFTFQRQVSPCWSYELSARVALGSNRSRTSINGSTTTTVIDDTTITPNGLLTQETNIGNFERSKFSSIGEFGLTARRSLRCGWTALAGYRFLYWTGVHETGNQIDTRVNPTQIPPGTLTGPPFPGFLGKTETFWAQGLHFGLEYAF